MRHKYTYGLAKVTGRPPEIETRAYSTGDDFERVSAGIVECQGRLKNSVRDRVYLVLEGEGTFRFGGEEGQDEEAVPVVEEDASPIPRATVHGYEGRTRLFLSRSPAYEQDSGVHHDYL